MSGIDRYRSIIPQWSTFLQMIESRDPPTIRARTGRISRDGLRALLEDRGFRFETVPGLPDHLRVVDAPHAVSQTPEHWLGLFYVQQASTGVAGPALAPRPGERVLDLCAAPGGKTTHLSDLMRDRGCLVAADVNENRLRALLGNVYRTGHSNVLVVSGDGRRLPAESEFDRVLVDAPCSAEGTLRKRKGGLRPQNREFLSGLLRRQETLLRRAIAITRPGGTILYSTCTFAPEENEGVLSAVLADAPVEIEPIGFEGPHAPGVTEFEGTTFDPRVEQAVRLYPHHLDSGGLFLAKLRRLDDGTSPAGGWSPVPSVFPDDPTPEPEARETIVEATRMLTEGVGVPPETLERFGWIVRGRNVWAHGCGEWPIDRWTPGNHWRVVSVGLRALTPGPRNVLRPTNDLIRIVERIDEALTYRPTSEEWDALLAGERIPYEGGPRGTRGLVLNGRLAGRGVAGDGYLRHEISRVQANTLREVFEVSRGSGPAPR